MLTPQEVSSHAFPKAVMGGYNMASVDEFLDELTDDYSALYKENAALKSKLKVLVEKVEDYRATEDSMRATLLTAQKMADSIVKEAEAKRDGMLAEARAAATEQTSRLQAEVEATQRRLQAGKQELAEFIQSVRTACGRELSFLDQLGEMAVELPEQKAEEIPAVDEIEQKILADYAAEEPAAEAPAEEPAAEEDEYPEGNPFAEPANSEPTRRINLGELKFGRNYTGEDD